MLDISNRRQQYNIGLLLTNVYQLHNHKCRELTILYDDLELDVNQLVTDFQSIYPLFRFERVGNYFKCQKENLKMYFYTENYSAFENRVNSYLNGFNLEGVVKNNLDTYWVPEMFLGQLLNAKLLQSTVIIDNVYNPLVAKIKQYPDELQSNIMRLTYQEVYSHYMTYLNADTVTHRLNISKMISATARYLFAKNKKYPKQGQMTIERINPKLNELVTSALLNEDYNKIMLLCLSTV
jgi:hypothetical protein